MFDISWVLRGELCAVDRCDLTVEKELSFSLLRSSAFDIERS